MMVIMMKHDDVEADDDADVDVDGDADDWW